MPGNLSPLNMQAWAISEPRADGAREAAYMGPDAIGGFFCAFAIQWPGDPNFTQVFGFPLVSFEDDAVRDILVTGGIYDKPFEGGPSWKELEDGTAGWRAPDEAYDVTGTPAMVQRFQYWLKDRTVAICEEASDVAWFRNQVLADMQHFRDMGFNGLVNPGLPGPRKTAGELFPPQKTGLIQSAIGLLQAQGSRLCLTLDPKDPNRTIVGAYPVPQ